MTDETANAGSTDEAIAGTPEDQPEPVIKIAAHFIRDLSFENVAARDGVQGAGTPEINVNVNLDAAATGEDRFTIAMKVNATAKVGDATRFLVELDYVGVFEVKNVPQEHVHPVLFIECPRQLLPYARRVVSDVTRDGGYPPLMLDNVDFAALYRGKLEELRAQQAAAQAAQPDTTVN